MPYHEVESFKSFEEHWKCLNGKYQHLQAFCGALATVFPGTATVESDFSLINFEKSKSRYHLTNLCLEGILLAKQQDTLQSLKRKTQN